MAKRQNLQLTIAIMLGNNLPKIHQEKNGVLLGYGTIKGQTVTIIANKYDRGSSNYVGHMLTQDHIYVNNHYNSENHEKILV